MIISRRKGKGQWDTTLKVDMSKEYDHLEWSFLADIMLRMRFLTRFVDLILLCVSTVQYHVLCDDELLGPITPTRGLRRGTRYPPNLLLFVSGLSALIRKYEGMRRVHGCKGYSGYFSSTLRGCLQRAS